MNRINIETYLKTVKLENNQSVRLQCPLCKGPNTLSLTKDNGNLKYLCFRVNCSIRGIIPINRDVSDVYYSINHLKRNTQERDREPQEPFEIPWYWTSIANHEEAFLYLKNNNCLEAYYDRACNIMFDPRANRVVFTIRRRSDGVCIDAVGRSLNRLVSPKWYRYNHSDYPFIVGGNDVAVLVEDAASACSVYAAGYAGVALLGTNLKSTYLASLKGFRECIIALDPDAAKKSIKVAQAINPYVPTKIRFIKNDLKYFTKDEIRKQLA